MSDKDYSPHECWCDTQNGISDYCNCMAGGYIEIIESQVQVIERLREGLSVYANWSNWERGGTIKSFDQEEIKGEFQYAEETFNKEIVGGKLARKVLEETAPRAEEK